jgi:dTDP-4-amino-4,6-dideoxygalactose transaminase
VSRTTTPIQVPMHDLRAEYGIVKEQIDAAIKRVIDGSAFVMGDELEAFEEEYARYQGVRYAVGVGSGTSAVHLALRACGVGTGDEVITVPNTDVSTSASISHCGASIVWVDVDPKAFTIDPQKIEEKITPKTKAILPVHLFGHPADMDMVVHIARRHRLLVIEDSALAVGAEYRGKKVGSIGDAGCFSFSPTKILGAFGAGGMVVTDNPEIMERLRVLRNYGFDLSHEDHQALITGIPNWKTLTEGFNDQLDTLQAAILRVKLAVLDQRLEKRREIARTYSDRLADLDLTPPFEARHVKHVYRAYPILVDNRDNVRHALRSSGIATTVYYVPLLHLQPAYSHLHFGPGSFPVAEHVADRMLCLPIFPSMTQDQVATVISALEDCVSH